MGKIEDIKAVREMYGVSLSEAKGLVDNYGSLEAVKRRMGDIGHMVDCGLCGKHTRNTGTKRCDLCWELQWRVERSPEIARTILNNLGASNGQNDSD